MKVDRQHLKRKITALEKERNRIETLLCEHKHSKGDADYRKEYVDEINHDIGVLNQEIEDDRAKERAQQKKGSVA